MQVAEQLSTGRIRLLDWMREVPVEVYPRHGEQFRRSQDTDMSRSQFTATPPSLPSTRHHVHCASIGEFTFVSPVSRVSLRAPTQSGRSNPAPYNNVDHYHPWRTLHKEGAGRSWAFSETSSVCLR